MQVTIEVRNLQLTFSDSDIVNPDEFIPAGEYNPHNVRPWLLHDHGFPVAVVFADSLQDALDIAVDACRMDRYQIQESDYDDYGINGEDPTCSFLGNAGEPFDIDTLGYVELRNPAFSFCALWDIAFRSGGGVLSSHFA